MLSEDRYGDTFYQEDTTEEHSLDELARELANGTISRRRALQLVGASLLGFAVPTLGLPGTAEARRRRRRHRRRGGTCPPSGTGCDTQCTNTNKDCRCVRTTDGRACVHPCCGDRGCETSADCPGSQLCLRSDCCGPFSSVCVTPCSQSRPAGCSDTIRSASSETPPSGGGWSS